MAEFRSLRDRSTRPPTSAELVRLAELREAGVADIYLEPEEAPPEFWENVVQATFHLLTGDGPQWAGWEREVYWSNGWPALKYVHSSVYRLLLTSGEVELADGRIRRVGTAGRLGAIEHLLDELDDEVAAEFADLINDRARWHRVGLRVEGRRFVPVTSELMHVEVTQPTLLLLAADHLASVDGLYRKAFDRALSEDPSGGVTAATSAVEEMFRIMLGISGSDMEALAKRARSDGLIPAAVYQFAVKLAALRKESDAHEPGTDDYDVAMLAIHLAGSLLLYLGRSESSG